MKNITNLIFEAYHLKRISRSGGQMLGANLGSIAEHSFFVSLIGFFLAEKEKANTEKIVLMCLIHDLPETRVGDANFIFKKYQVLLEKQATTDQTKSLDKYLSTKLANLFKEYSVGESRESKLVKDADILEQMFGEKMAHEVGNSQAKEWMKHSYKKLHSKSAKALGKHIKNTNSYEWWQSLHKNPNKVRL